VLNDGYVYSEQVGGRGESTVALYLARKYRHSPLSEWQARCARGEVRVDGAVVDGEGSLRPGQRLSWHRPPWDEPDAPQAFGVAYEDAHLLAVIKPSGLPTLPSGGFLQNTLLHRVRARWPGADALHRLGRATSGLVLFSLSRAAAAGMSRSWREGAVEKHYRALSSGSAVQDRYEISAPIGCVPHPLLGWVHGADPAGKPSASTALVLERRQGQTLFDVQIHTGRPEQVRIHLAFIGHPLVGDPVFAPGGRPREDGPGLPGDGGYLLHAESLGFEHPVSGERLLLRAPPPGELQPAT
jgi:23S rRNA pseudouridine1911/1915/1917 synthase